MINWWVFIGADRDRGQATAYGYAVHIDAVINSLRRASVEKRIKRIEELKLEDHNKLEKLKEQLRKKLTGDHNNLAEELRRVDESIDQIVELEPTFEKLPPRVRVLYNARNWAQSDTVLTLRGNYDDEDWGLGKGVRLGPEHADALAVIICHRPRLEVLNLWDNKLGDSVKKLAPAIRTLSSLTELDLHTNNVSDAGVTALLPALPASIEELRLTSNERITDASVAPIAAELPRLRKLDHLYLWGSGLTDEGKAKLRKAWKAAGKPNAEGGGGLFTDSGLFFET